MAFPGDDIPLGTSNNAFPIAGARCMFLHQNSPPDRLRGAAGRAGGNEARKGIAQRGSAMASTTMTDWRRLHGNAFQGQRVLITGGAGFIGSHLAEALVALGAQVVVIDDLSGGSRENLEAFPTVEFVQGSILDADAVARCTTGCRFVFHQAALGSVPRSVEQPRLYNDVNTTGTLNVVEAAREAGAARVMFAASSSAYGDNPVPWVETMPTLPKSPYAATKVAGEALFRAYSSSYGVDTACLRYFNIFGPRQNANSAYAAVIAAFAKAVIAGQRPVIYGDGEQSRDFTFVHNAVHANLLAARREAPIGGEVINVGTGSRISVNQLSVQVARLLGRPELKPVYEPERTGDIKHSFADLGRARSVLGYQPVSAFEAGLDRTLAWYREVLA
jgi:UDP-glucose 4-epimerase